MLEQVLRKKGLAVRKMVFQDLRRINNVTRKYLSEKADNLENCHRGSNMRIIGILERAQGYDCKMNSVFKSWLQGEIPTFLATERVH